MKVPNFEGFFTRGNVRIDVHHASEVGCLEDTLLFKPIYTYKCRNKIPLEGRNLFRDVMKGVASAPTFIAMGTASSASDDATTSLGSERHRNAITQRISVISGLTYKFFLPATAGNGFDFAEGLISNSSATSSGTILSRVIYTPIPKNANITITMTWNHLWTTT